MTLLAARQTAEGFSQGNTKKVADKLMEQ